MPTASTGSPRNATCSAATEDDSTPGYVAYSGGTGTVQMVNDNDTPVLSTLSSGLAPVVGRVVTSLGATTVDTGVGGGTVKNGVAQNSVLVHVQAVIGYVGGDPIVSDPTTTKVRTDANGCFAIVAHDTPSVTAPSDCGGSVSGGSVLTLKLTSPIVTVSIDAGSRTQNLTSQQFTFSGSLTKFPVVATPATSPARCSPSTRA